LGIEKVQLVQVQLFIGNRKHVTSTNVVVYCNSLSIIKCG